VSSCAGTCPTDVPSTASTLSARSAPTQGLTLVHFSAQLEPCLTHKNILHTLNTPYTPPYHGLRNRYAHPLSYKKRSG
jgi:hypothetical protein